MSGYCGGFIELDFFLMQERDTSAEAVTMPVPTGDPFPRIFHRSEIKSEVRGRTSCSVLSSLTTKTFPQQKAMHGEW